MSPREREGRAAGPLTIRVSVIGRCDILLGRTRVRPDSAVLFALLLYLTLRAGRRVARDELLDLLWPGAPDRSRRHALRQLLYRVRRAGVPLDVDGHDLTIEPTAVSADIGAIFDPAWGARVRAADIPSPRSILPSYRPALGSAFDAWIESIRDDAAIEIRRACLRHVAAGRREGRWDDVEAVARICLVCDPLNEDATLGLAEATAMAGAQAESLRILDAYLWEIGGQTGNVGHEAKLLRRRIASQPLFHLVRAGEPPLIGRSDDLSWLNERRDAVGTGTPVTAMLVGPPGIGKTAIARAFTGYAEMRGWQVAVARLQPTDVDRPMSVFLELLPRLLKAPGALGAAPESIAQLRRLVGLRSDDEDILAGLSQEAEAVQARIRASAFDLLGAVSHEGPTILLLEDLHWSDASSLRLLAWLVEHADALPVLWLLTSRMESRFAALRDAFPADRVPARTVGPLGAVESAELFTAYVPASRRNPRIAEMAFAATGGNPLFIREVAGHWTETGDQKLPANLRSLMTERVARLTPASQRVLHCCAVLGRFATVPRVSAVLELTTVELLEAIEELDGLGLVGLGGEPGSLALHDLWQEQLISTMRASALALLHLRSGEVLETESQGDRSAAIVVDAARHLIAAGAKARAIQLLCEAAEHQLANGLTQDAVATSRQGWVCATQPAEKVRSERLFLRALHQAGQWEEILAIGPVIGPTEPADPHVPHNEAELLVIEALWRTDRAATFAVLRAIACAEDRSCSSEHRLLACLISAQAASNMFDRETLHRAKRVAQVIPRSTETEHVTGLTTDVVLETEIGDLTAAIDAARQLVDIERRRNSLHGLPKALRFAAYPSRSAGDLAGALAYAAEAYAMSERYQLAEQAAQSADVCATTQLELGDLDSAEIWLSRAEGWGHRLSLRYLGRSHCLLRGLIAVTRGDIAGASHALRSIDDTSRATPREARTILELRCRILLLQQDEQALEEVVLRLEAALKVSRSFIRQDAFVDALIKGMRALGRHGEAARYAEEYCSAWRRDRTPFPESLRGVGG